MMLKHDLFASDLNAHLGGIVSSAGVEASAPRRLEKHTRLSLNNLHAISPTPRASRQMIMPMPRKFSLF